MFHLLMGTMIKTMTYPDGESLGKKELAVREGFEPSVPFWSTAL